jgi:arylsulfatase A-like enzyme
MNRNRKWQPTGLMLVCWAATLTGQLLATAADQPPNIVFVFTDDHAAHAMSCYGSKVNHTPHLDRIAAEGMRFNRCYVTNALCGPSRATILTGKHSHANGFRQNGDRFDGSQVTFPKLLQAAKYQTAVIGKWHLESDPTGFDHWDILIGQGPYYNPTMIRNGEKVKREGYTTEIIGELTRDWLRQRDPQRPFLLMTQHKAPHREWQPGPKQFGLFAGQTIPEPPTLFDDYQGRSSAARKQTLSVAQDLTELDLKFTPPKGLTPAQLELWTSAYRAENERFRQDGLTGKALVRWKYQRYMKDYLRCVQAVDDEVGLLLDELQQLGLADNTIVVYSSDQGFFLGDHGWFDKRFMYEECYRTPLLVKWPGVTAPGSVCDRLVSNLDLAQTFLAAAGVTADPSMQGASLLPLLKGESPADWRTSLYYHYYEYPGVHDVARHYGVTTGRHKLIHFYHNDEWELFDLEQDPHELRSLYNDPAAADVQQILMAELQRLREVYHVPDDPRPEPGTGAGGKGDRAKNAAPPQPKSR